MLVKKIVSSYIWYCTWWVLLWILYFTSFVPLSLSHFLLKTGILCIEIFKLLCHILLDFFLRLVVLLFVEFIQCTMWNLENMAMICAFLDLFCWIYMRTILFENIFHKDGFEKIIVWENKKMLSSIRFWNCDIEHVA